MLWKDFLQLIPLSNTHTHTTHIATILLEHLHIEPLSNSRYLIELPQTNNQSKQDVQTRTPAFLVRTYPEGLEALLEVQVLLDAHTFDGMPSTVQGSVPGPEDRVPRV